MTLKELASEIKLIKENHLAHMAEDIDKMEKKLEKMDGRLWAIIVLLLGAVVLPAIVSFVKTNF